MFGGYYLGQLYLGISGLPSAGELSVVPSSHQLSSDNLTLTQKHTLIVDSVAHSLTSQNITLTQKHVLSVDNALHNHLGDNASITSEHFLGMDDAYHGLSSTEIQLTQKHSIVVSNTTHGLSSSNLDLVEHKTLAVSSTSHGHTVDGVVLAVRSFLDVSNSTHSHIAGNVTLTQRQYLAVADSLIAHYADSLGGLINLEPFGLGGGFGAVDGFGIVGFGSINIELPINLYIFADSSYHALPTDYFDTFTQIFNMIRKGDYLKDFSDNGSVGSEYTKATGTMPSKNGSFGQITPVSDSNQGFLILDVIPGGSYTESAKYSGIISKTNSSDGSYLPDEEDTGNYVKIK